MKVPNTIYQLRNIVGNVMVIPLFAMLFLVIYVPHFGNGNIAFSQQWEAQSSFCIPIVSAIILGVVAFSRTLLYFYSHKDPISQLHYFIWLVVEFIVSCLFVDLFLALLFQLKFFDLLPSLILYGALILIFPYLALWSHTFNNFTSKQLAEAQQRIAELELGSDKNDGAIKFVDDKGNVKLIVGANKVIFIESAGNYVNIVYDNGDKLTRFCLRNTLKGIENICVSNDLVRCHRSYFVNLHKVKVLRKDADVIYAEIDYSGVDDIPVSKTYASEVIRMFNN